MHTCTHAGVCLTTMPHRKLIRRHYVFLMNNVDVTFSDIVDRLFESGTLDEYDVNGILSEQTSHRRLDKVFETIMRRPPTDFNKFLDVLRQTKHQHVADRLQNDLTNGLSHVIVTSSRAKCHRILTDFDASCMYITQIRFKRWTLPRDFVITLETRSSPQ